MVGCCGQGQGRGYEGALRGAFGPGGAGARCVTASHNEDVCHGTGERRRDLLDQVKIFLNEFDERPCQATPQGLGSNVRPLGEYDEYRRKHCQSWAPAQPRPPLITSVQTHEVRPTEDYERMRHQNTEYVSFVDARMKPPPATCDCAKRNGLQDQCPRPECKPPTAQCLASNPGPCCPPSLGLTRQEATGAGRPQRQNRQGIAQYGQQGYGQDAPGGGITQYGQGGPMICFCPESPSSLPKGKNYLCCPAPY